MGSEKQERALIVSLIALETIAQASLRLSAENSDEGNSWFYWLAGILCYACLGALFAAFLRTGKEVGAANAIWDSGTGLTAVILGYTMFGEVLTARQICGVVLAVLSVGFLI